MEIETRKKYKISGQYPVLNRTFKKMAKVGVYQINFTFNYFEVKFNSLAFTRQVKVNYDG